MYPKKIISLPHLCDKRSPGAKSMAAPLAGIAAPDPAPRMLLLLLLLLPPPLSRGRVAVCGSGGLHGFCLCDLKHGTEQYRRRQVGHLYFGGASLQTPHFTTAGGTASCCCCCCACWCRLLPRPRFPAPLPLPLLPPLPPRPPILFWALTALLLLQSSRVVEMERCCSCCCCGCVFFLPSSLFKRFELFYSRRVTDSM